MTHYNGGVYDIGFNSPPDFTGPMSNRSDISDNDKRIVMLHRQKSGISSPQGIVGFITRLLQTPCLEFERDACRLLAVL